MRLSLVYLMLAISERFSPYSVPFQNPLQLLQQDFPTLNFFSLKTFRKLTVDKIVASQNIDLGSIKDFLETYLNQRLSFIKSCLKTVIVGYNFVWTTQLLLPFMYGHTDDGRRKLSCILVFHWSLGTM